MKGSVSNPISGFVCMHEGKLEMQFINEFYPVLCIALLFCVSCSFLKILSAVISQCFLNQ